MERADSYWQILLVGKNEQQSIPQLILVQHALKLLTSLDYTVTIVTIDNKNDALGVLEVMSPQRSDLVLTTDVPDCKLNVLVFDGLDVEACGRASISNSGEKMSRLSYR